MIIIKPFQTFCILKDGSNLANRRSIVQDCVLNQLQYHSGNQSNQIIRNVLRGEKSFKVRSLKKEMKNISTVKISFLCKRLFDKTVNLYSVNNFVM